MQMGQTGDRTSDLQVGGPLYPSATATPLEEFEQPAGHVLRLGEQSPRRPPHHAAGGSVCGTPRRFFRGGGARPRCRGFPSSMPRGGVRRRCGRRGPVGGDRVRRSATATLDVCRALLADHLSYSAR
ncbi:unnamed protein product [Pleuronectes platessa]|uniref:Uncharacterized protein n=1 Tax=Pleuronectes platessa TaxID=8262 RepID=A0A9N7U2E3_PLEPL|nr:unnamed protein product [Pleuronectes platessa]